MVLRPNYHKAKYFTENLLVTERCKTKVKLHKPVYLGLSVLDIRKIAMYEYWYDYVKPRYEDNAKLCSTDTDSSIVHVKTEYLAQTLNYDVQTPLPIGKNKKVIGLMRDELSRRIMKEFIVLRPNIYISLTNDDHVDKKSNATKKCVIKREIEFQDYKDYLKNKNITFKSQQRFKSQKLYY